MTSSSEARSRPPAKSVYAGIFAWLTVLGLCLAHTSAIVAGMGGWSGLNGRWPIARHDHSLYFHSALVTRDFLAQSGTTAGYDPTFMAGYPKSIIFPASSTLPELAIAAFGSHNPVLVYHWYVLVCAAAYPFLIAAAAAFWGGPRAAWTATGLALIYLWTDFPINYVEFGMLPYFLSVPMGLLTTALLLRFLTHGGRVSGAVAASASALLVMTHFTSAFVVVPAVMLTYLVFCRTAPATWRRHLGFWCIPCFVVVINAFWWWPGIVLADTKGVSDFAFSHSQESVWARLWQPFSTAPGIEGVLWIAGGVGLIGVLRYDRLVASAIGGLVLGGLFWGYLAGWFPALDFLQPGRHTFTFYSALAVAAGVGFARISHGWTESGNHRYRSYVSRGVLFCAAIAAIWGFGTSLRLNVQYRIGDNPFLSSRPTPILTYLVRELQLLRKEHSENPDEILRVLYEEGGKLAPGPFGADRYSGVLPWLVPGLEFLGGPYLYCAVTTNFTQFGEGRLFGAEQWDRAFFDRYARIYRPDLMVCWSPWARRFCYENPDRIQIVKDAHGVLIGRVLGFPTRVISGQADVIARPGRLIVTPKGSSAGTGTTEAENDLEGWVVLGYHYHPSLRVSPAVRLEPILLEGDPVPFIRLERVREPVTLELNFGFGFRSRPARIP